MAKNKVRFHFADGEQVEVEVYDQLNLLAHAQIAERSLQSRCGGQCECGTCRIYLKSGQLCPMGEEERLLLEKVGARSPIDPRTRLSCRSFPVESNEDVEILVPSERFKDARHTQS